MKVGGERSMLLVPTFVLLKKPNPMMKVYVILCVNGRVAKWTVSVLNRVSIRRPRRHTSTQNFFECSLGFLAGAFLMIFSFSLCVNGIA